MLTPLRALLPLLVVAFIVLAPAQPVAAHAELERAEPPPEAVLPTTPGEVRLWMTETVEPTFSEIQILDTTGRPVAGGRPVASPDGLSMTLALPTLPDGVYTVAWKVTSTVDGHTTRGFHGLGVGVTTSAPTSNGPVAAPVAPAGPPVLAQAAVRWLAFIGQALLVGSLVFGLLVLTPALAAGGAALSASIQAARRRRARLHGAALAALALAALAALVLQAASAAEVSVPAALGAPLAAVLGTRYGLVWAGRILLLALLAGLVLWLARRPVTPRWTAWLGVALGLGLLLTTSLTSHAAASREAPWLAVAADWLHLVATSAWVGGLAQFVLVLPALLAVCPEQERTRLLSTIVSRFSTLALAAVGLLLLSGVYGTILSIDRPEALLTTDYGRALGSKVLLLLPMLALGALNLLRQRPALARAASAARRAGIRGAAVVAARARVVLGRSVRAELILGLLILAATGVLTSIAPARQATATSGGGGTGITVSETVGDARLTLRITPAVPGDNTLELTVTRDGRPLEGVSKALVRLTLLDQELGEREVVLTPAGGERYLAQGRHLSVAGRWQAELIVRREGQDDLRTGVRFPIPGGGATAAAPTATPSLDPRQLAPLAALALAAALLSVGLALRRRRTLSSALVGTSVGSMVLAIGLFALGLLNPGSGVGGVGLDLRNPYPPTAQSLSQGRTLYTTNCQACHGVTGKGDGPAGIGLNPPPLDLTVHVSQHPDRELYRMVSQGVRGSAMPPFAGQLTEEERWHLLNYIRTFDAYKTADRLGVPPR